jgi:hypothetical protein
MGPSIVQMFGAHFFQNSAQIKKEFSINPRLMENSVTGYDAWRDTFARQF